MFIPEGTELIASGEWRIIGFEWTPDTITMYAEGKPFCTWDIRGEDYDVFRNWPMQVIFNTNSTKNTSQVKGAEGAVYTYIDYFRVYQRDNVTSGYDSIISKTSDKNNVKDATMALPTK